jgi:hypothetical protein
MAEQIIASHKWRRRTRDWSAVCDNNLKLDRTYSLLDNPSSLNQYGICAPDCEMCITPYPRNIENQSCYCETIPLFYDVVLPAPLMGIHPWSNCYNVLEAQCRFAGMETGDNPSKVCAWNSPVTNTKIAHRRTEAPWIPNVGWTYDCRNYLTFVRSFLGVSTQKKPGSATLGRMTVSGGLYWGYDNGQNIQLRFVWRGDISSCFGEWTLPFSPENSTMTWLKNINVPSQGTYSLGSFFSWPGEVKVTSL